MVDLEEGDPRPEEREGAEEEEEPRAEAPAKGGAGAETAPASGANEGTPTAQVQERPRQQWNSFLGKQLVAPSSEPSCKHCRTVVDPTAKGVRVTGKSPPTFCCGSCNAKTTSLAHVFGHWPIDEFKELTPDEQATFFQTAGQGKDNLKKAVEQQVMKRWVHQKTNKVAGDFLPEWWWRNKGMPEDEIKKMKDVAPSEEHPIFGTGYQVQIHGTDERATEELVRQQMLAASSRKRKLCGPGGSGAAGSGSQAEALTEGAGPGKPASETSSSSSSSSSSSNSKQKKKKKKGKKKKGKKSRKKDEKNKEKAERDKADKAERDKADKAEKGKLRKEKAERERADKEEKKAWRQTHADAAKALGKVTPAVLQMESVLEHKMFGEVPKVLRKGAQQVYDALKKAKDEAQTAVKTQQPAPLSFTLEDATASVKQATECYEKLKGVLETTAAAMKA